LVLHINVIYIDGLSAYAVAKQLGIAAHTVAKYSPFDVSAGDR